MVLRDRRFQMPVGLGLSLQGITSGKIWDRTSNGILSLDGEQHTRLRRLVAQGFTPRATDRLRPYIREVINELVDTVSPRGECDLVADITEQYPIPIVCALLVRPVRIGSCSLLGPTTSSWSSTSTSSPILP